MTSIRHRHAWLAVLVAAVMANAGAAWGGESDSAFVMPPVLQLQAANGLSNEDVLRIVARDNLMLAPREAALIEAALRSADDADDDMPNDRQEPAPQVLRDLRLDALLYLSPSSWSLWLNGGLVTPASVPPGLRVNAITPRFVEFVWLPDPARPEELRIFTLRPQQVYVAETNDVIGAEEYAMKGLDLLPAVPPVETLATPTPDVDEHARPEELSLTQEQADQLRDLENALEAQE